MKSIIFLTTSILVILTSCSNEPEIQYQILSSNLTAVDNNTLSQGQFVSSKTQINLDSGEELLITNEEIKDVYSIKGPLKNSINSVINLNEFKSFSKKYFSFLIENVNKKDNELANVVSGGVTRSRLKKCKYINEESLVSDEILNLNDLCQTEACDFTVYLDDELIEISDNNIDLSQLRDRENDQLITIKCKRNNISQELTLNLICKISKELLEKTEQEILSNSDLPKEALMDFYLTNKMIDSAKKHQKSNLIKNPFYSKALKSL